MFLVLCLFLACGEKRASQSQQSGTEEKVIIVRATGNPFSFTPNYQADDYGWPMHQNIYNRLCKLDASKSIPIPDLAERWEYSDDVKTLTFYLFRNAKWHDGVAVTSADVKYTFDTIKANPSYYFSPQMEIVDSITAPNDYTVVFNLNTPDASFVSLLGWYATFVLPKHVYDIGVSWADNPAGSKPNGSGPFKFESFKDSESITLARNPNYHGGVPKLDKVIYSLVPDLSTAVQALLNGEIDHLESLPTANVADVQTNQNLKLIFNEYPSPIRLIFNMNAEPVNNINVRRAIAYAIDRDEISTKAYFGYNKPEYNLYTSFISWATNKEDTCPPYNPAEAKRILEAAGYRPDSRGYYVTCSLDYFPTLAGGDDVAKLLQAQLRAAGINLEIISNEYQAWTNKMNRRNFQIELQGGFMGPDPAALKNRLVSGMASNYGDYSNAEFDALITKGAESAKIEERAGYYMTAQKILATDLPYLPLTGVASPEAYWDNFYNMPIEGAGKWGWAEYTFTDTH
jgi:peptide/nickel transport system substrate-binding protein